MPVPLCVDLDGTLVRTDTFVEGMLALIRRRPGRLPYLFAWLFRGRAYCKNRVARECELQIARLPYNDEVVAALAAEKDRGRCLVLVTGADGSIARQVAGHLGLFDEVLASDGATNLTGQEKANVLVERFGRRGFAYAGNSAADLHVWRQAQEAICVGGRSASLVRALRKEGITAATWAGRTPGFTALLRSLRPQQVTKNLLLFVPILAAHDTGNTSGLLRTLLGFGAFCLCASATYLLNDLLDVEADRNHPLKRLRPFASGELPAWLGLVMIPTLGLGGLFAAAVIGREFLGLALGYCAATAAYSFGLKQIAIVDVLLLAALYTLRVLAGGASARVTVSPWLMAFSMFLFLSLAFAKRCAELRNLNAPADTAARCRGYFTTDYEPLARFGTASAYLATLVLALYIQSAETGVLYKHPLRLWGMCPLLIYWTSRIWLLASRGELHEDPLSFALQDKASYLAAAAAGILFLLS